MIFEVLVPVLLWWLVTTLIALSALPMAQRFFGNLPSQGIGYARPLGLLLAGLLYWLLVMAGLPNNALGVWVVILALAVAGLGLWRQEGVSARAFFAEHKERLLGFEGLYLAGLVLWALYRSFNPNIETAGGEKYMEMAFISGILDSRSFPPADPWLSGGTISYYYFGYLVASLLTTATGIFRFEAFNLLVPMTMGLTLAAAGGLGYDLVGLAGGTSRIWRWATGVFTGLILALMGSLQGLLELAYMRAWASRETFDWLAVKNLGGTFSVCGETNGAYESMGWVPGRFIWWWRGSRVIYDGDPRASGCREVIHEFPFFSFMLGDAHPHVMAIPYGLLCLALALSVLNGGFDIRRERDLFSPRHLILPLAVGAMGFLNTWDLPTYLFVMACAIGLRALAKPVDAIRFEDRRINLGLVAAGTLAVLAVARRGAGLVLSMTSGLPAEELPATQHWAITLAVFVMVLVLVQSLWSLAREGHGLALRALDAARSVVWLTVLAVVFYLPFYLDFASQASGMGVVDIRTRLPHWIVHFGPHYWLAISLVLLSSVAMLRGPRRSGSRSFFLLIPSAISVVVMLYSLSVGAWTAAMLAATLGLACYALLDGWITPLGDAITSHALDPVIHDVDLDSAGGEAAEIDGATGGESGEPEQETEASLDATGSELEAPTPEPELDPSPALPVAATFALLCVSIGLLLPLGTEFVFIRDLFGNRMNSIFKLYYQAWILLSVGGGFAIYQASRRLPRPAAIAWALPTFLLVGGGLVFTLMAVASRTNRFDFSQGLSLNGLRWWETVHVSDLEAAEWLRENTEPGSVILESYAAGGYSHSGRISMASGRPAVLGWSGHQHQWRGNDALPLLGERKQDVDSLYGAAGEPQAQDLLEKYGIRYVIIGGDERGQTYYTDAAEARFARMLDLVFTSSDGQLKIYAR